MFSTIELTVFRMNPSWKYQMQIRSIESIKERKGLFGKKYNELVVSYHVDVNGIDISNSTNNNNMRFSKTFDHSPNNVEIDRFIDEYHARVRKSVAESDWDAEDKAKKAAEWAAKEEALRKKFEEELAKAKKEAEDAANKKIEEEKLNTGVSPKE